MMALVIIIVVAISIHNIWQQVAIVADATIAVAAAAAAARCVKAAVVVAVDIDAVGWPPWWSMTHSSVWPSSSSVLGALTCRLVHGLSNIPLPWSSASAYFIMVQVCCGRQPTDDDRPSDGHN